MTHEASASSTPMLSGLARTAAEDKKFAGLLTHVGDPRLHLSLVDQARPWTIAALAHKARLLVVTANGREAEDLTAELKAMLGEKVAFLPSWETLPHERLSPGMDIVGRRAHTLDTLQDYRVVVTPARSYCQPVLNTEQRSIRLQADAECDFEQLRTQLVFFGYSHVDMVSRRGEFATRGGIIDVFPTTADQAVRIEFWGDEVSEMREFAVADQRAIADRVLEQLSIYPARTLLIDDAVAGRARELARTYAHHPALGELLDKISTHTYADGMEALLPVLSPHELVPLPQVLGSGWHVLELAPQKIMARISDLIATDEEFLAAGWEVAAMGGTAPVASADLDLSAGSYVGIDALHDAMLAHSQPHWTAAEPGILEASEDLTLPVELSLPPQPRGDLKEIESMMKKLLAHTLAGGKVAYIAPAKGAIKRMRERFKEQGIRTTVASPGWQPSDGEVTLYQAFAHNGVVFDGPNLVVITETDLTGNRVGDIAGAKRRPAKKRNRVDPLALKKGDYVVHDTHGIGRFVEMTERTITTGDGTSRREYVVLEYASSKRGAPADKLYVPMDSIDLLSKYVGGETPTLSKMGGSDWKNTKRKARAAVREIAGELIELYAKRQAAPGYAFAPDSPWQKEMEDNFPFVETEDQMLAIQAVKEDMEKPVPMDRVVVGDVGYGKTEVAVRAAFKAVQDGKQVALLVPTTLLAQQHLSTFEERMAGFPVTIRGLSRFTSTAEAKEIISGLASGEVDVVIGTHRLLQTGVTWKNLGLVIVDEEQRFGVEHKEHIKGLRTHVDVLTMSATPIPRTLEMSMAGIREMSTILTPPEDRHPVLTYVGAAEDKQIAAAIRREILRDGQVFFVHNKVKDIDKRASELRDLVPEARIVVAHGQMSEQLLEQTVQGFWNRDYDVLVCTTIVETGLDIANANTLIVENAHHMGLSQLHQLRGRVGRSRERGYAYFLYPKGVLLTEIAYDRLSTIAHNNDLGAGMAVAMKDLEMRGAGNVLGAEQSGHIAGVGFDLYMRLVGEAVETFRALASGQPLDATEKESTEIRIDLPVDAHIPDSYINSERLRLDMYRTIAAANTEEELGRAVDDMSDRFGQPPVEVQRLLTMARLRRVAARAQVADIVVQGNRIKIHPVELKDSQQVRLKRLYGGSTYRAAAKAVMVPLPKAGRTITDPQLRDVELVQWVADFLSTMFQLDRVNVSTGVESAMETVAPVVSSSTAEGGRAARSGAPAAGTRRLRAGRGGTRTAAEIDEQMDIEDKREARRRKYRLR